MVAGRAAPTPGASLIPGLIATIISGPVDLVHAVYYSPQNATKR
jgi:hypothetical protein